MIEAVYLKRLEEVNNLRASKMALWPTAVKYDLQLFQVRLLDFLYRCHLKQQCSTQTRVREELGLTSISGTITTALNGIREGTKRGREQKGLIEWDMVCSMKVNGERIYTLTDFGVEVARQLRQEIEEEPNRMRPVRSAVGCTNYNKMVGKHGRED